MKRGLRHVGGIGRGAEPEPMVIEKIIFVEKAALEPAPAPKKKVPHLRAVPPPMSLPFFDDSKSAALNVSSLADEERAKLARSAG